MTARTRISLCSVALALALAGVAPRAAHARSDKLVSYAYEQVWPAAVRFLRIDQQLDIVERDAEAGYVIFELVDDGKTFRGTFQLVRTRDDRDREAVRVIANIVDRPAYMERVLLDRFERKLREELGPPAEPAPAPKSAPKPAPAPPAAGEATPSE